MWRGRGSPKDAPFYQDRGEPELVEGGVLELDALPEVTPEERRDYTERVAAAKARLAPARFQLVKAVIEQAEPTFTPDQVAALAEQRLAAAGGPGISLRSSCWYFFHRKKAVAVKDLSAAYDGLRLADPAEPDYRDGTDAIFHWRQGDWRIVSFAHGLQTTYQAVPPPPPDPDEEDVQDLLEHAPARPTRRAPVGGLPYDYDQNAAGLWLVEFTEKGEVRTQLTNFGATILEDIEEDDGTTVHPRFFEIEATQGEIQRTIRLAAKDFQGMAWVADALGAKARVFPGKYYKEHAHAAIQDLSLETQQRHTYTHTGWREIDGEWCYLHDAGAVTADRDAERFIRSPGRQIRAVPAAAPGSRPRGPGGAHGESCLA